MAIAPRSRGAGIGGRGTGGRGLAYVGQRPQVAAVERLERGADLVFRQGAQPHLRFSQRVGLSHRPREPGRWPSRFW